MMLKNKNIVSLEMTCYFVDEEGDALGIPKLRRLSLLEFAWVTHGGIPKLRLFTLLDHIISSFSLAT
jgi:hypothetical protein